jgi:hypothetical protein
MELCKKSISVNSGELHDAFDFVSAGALSEHDAYICMATGMIYCTSTLGELDEFKDELPEDHEKADRYIAVPHKNELGLGRRLALSFIAQELSRDYETVVGFFRRKGAYGRFKDLLEARDMLQKWYEYERSATEEALLSWCEENGIQLVDM